MEREIDKKNLVLKEDESIGTVQIADDVVAMIASLATTEVDGVSAMAGNITNELMSKVGVKNLTKGVKVEVQDKLSITTGQILMLLRLSMRQQPCKIVLSIWLASM